MIYLIMFLTSGLFYSIAEKRADIGKNYKIYLFLSGILPIILAALREEHIGTDVLYYLKGLYLGVPNHTTLRSYIIKYGNFEPLFLALVFYTTKIFGNIYAVQGVIHIFIICPVFYVIWNYRKRSKSTLSLAVFYFLFYMNTLNIMRQSIAIALCLLSFLELRKKKYLYFALCQVLAIGFHKTAIVNLFLIGIYLLMKSSMRKFYFGVLLTAMCIMMLYYEQIIYFLGQYFSFIPKRYLSDSYMLGSGNLSMPGFIYYGVNFVTIFLNSKQNDEWSKYLKVLTILSFLGQGLTYSMGVAVRIALYWNYYSIFTMPMFEKIIAKNRMSQWIFFLIFCCFIMMYWYYNFVFLGYAEVYPYRFGTFK